MSTLEIVLLSIRVITFICALVFGSILIITSKKAKPSALVGVFLLLVGLEVTLFILSHFFDIQFHPRILYSPLNFYFLGPPVLYLYLKKLVGKVDFATRKDWVHFLPGGIEFLLNLFLFTSLAVRQTGTDAFLFSLYNWYMLGSAAFTLFYCFLIYKRVEKDSKKVGEFYSTNYKRDMKWLNWVAILLAVKTLVALSFFFIFGGLSSSSAITTLPVAVINVLFIAYVGVSGWLQPRVLPERTAIKDFNQEMREVEQESKPKATREEEIAAEQQKLSEKFQELEALMKSEQPFLNPDISAFELARKVKVPQRKLSKIITENKYKNFNTYINHYRVEHAKEMLKSEAFEAQTILSIGFDSGFNSKATFYSTFKKFTGETPLQYRDVSILD